MVTYITLGAIVLGMGVMTAVVLYIEHQDRKHKRRE